MGQFLDALMHVIPTSNAIAYYVLYFKTFSVSYECMSCLHMILGWIHVHVGRLMLDVVGLYWHLCRCPLLVLGVLVLFAICEQLDSSRIQRFVCEIFLWSFHTVELNFNEQVNENASDRSERAARKSGATATKTNTVIQNPKDIRLCAPEVVLRFDICSHN